MRPSFSKLCISCLEAATIKKLKNSVNNAELNRKKNYFNILHAGSINARFFRWLRAVGGCAKSYYLLLKISIIYCAKSLLFNPRCGCPRCVDPTEFGTNTSGLPCGSCQGLLLPQVTPTESEYRVSSGGEHFAWMSPPVKYNKRYLSSIQSKKGGESPSLVEKTDIRLFLAKHCKQKNDHQNMRNLLFLCFMKTVISYETQRFHCLK
jgi:hypothetical protein